MHEFIEERRTRKRLKKLKGATTQGPDIKRKAGKGNAYQVTKTGYRPDIGILVRSSWEANVIRVLEIHGIAWEFEPRMFPYPVKRGTKAYVPDIYLPATNEWIEVKGYLDTRSKTKLKRFKIYYPEEFANLTMIVSKYSKACREFTEAIGVPNVIYYEELARSYKLTLGTHWQGK